MPLFLAQLHELLITCCPLYVSKACFVIAVAIDLKLYTYRIGAHISALRL
jgi:hypothetical protein